MIKRKYESSDKPTDLGNEDERTPKNQAIKLAGSPYDSSQSSTVRSRKAQKSKLSEQLSPLRQPQAIIGEGGNLALKIGTRGFSGIFTEI